MGKKRVFFWSIFLTASIIAMVLVLNNCFVAGKVVNIIDRIGRKYVEFKAWMGRDKAGESARRLRESIEAEYLKKIEQRIEQTEQQPLQLQLTISSDKQVYEVGDTINITYTITNVSDKPIIFFYGGIPYTEINFGNKEYEIFQKGAGCQHLGGGHRKKVLKPNENWEEIEEFACIKVGKIYDFTGSFKFKEKKRLYYNGFYLFRNSDCREILIKDVYGKYKLSSKFCASNEEDYGIGWVSGDKDFKDAWKGCIESNEIEIQIKESK